LSTDLEEAFGWTFTLSMLLLGAVFMVVDRSRRQAMAAVQLLETISTSSTDAIFAKDRQGRYLLFNKEASRVTGAPVESVIGHDDRMLFPPDQASQVMANDRRVMDEKHTRTYEEDVSTVEGGVTFLATKGPLLDSEGDVIGMFGIARNITERKSSERALLESRAQLETVIESLDQGLVIAAPDGKLLRWNRAAAAMYGNEPADECTAEFAPFRDAFELTTLDGAVVPFEEWPLNRIMRGERLRNIELSLRRKGTDWSRIHSFGGTLVQSADGQPMFSLLTISDVTPRHQAEESLRRTQRMEALGALAAGIAHDFNNILMAIAGNARLALDELQSGHAAREGLHEIVRASSRATDLVRSILLFSRAEEPQRRVVALEPLIEEALALVRPTTPAMIRFSTQFAQRVPPVSIDASQMHQVVVNLVTNAAYAIADGPHRQDGLIRIELDHCEIDADRPPPGQHLSGGPYVRLTVSDNGAGMEQSTLARIFDPFFTTKPAGQGTGLGMSVVHGIVRNHDGAITVQSQPNEGTSVQIYLPAAIEKILAPSSEHFNRPLGREKRILYLDDEEPLVSLAVRFLQKRGHSVTGFVNPVEALHAFKAQPQAFDIVVTDMSMPGMSGLEVAKAMLKVRPDIVIVMMSGYVRPEDRGSALALGVKELMLKPSTIEELADAVDRQVS
ncbi:MAG: hybrid sensor histidine kinase/response regulator, partial [Steroidobacter sp.]